MIPQVKGEVIRVTRFQHICKAPEKVIVCPDSGQF